MTATTLANQKAERAFADSITTAKPERRREIDMIGPLVVMGVIVLHTLMIFFDRRMIVNESQSMVTTIVAQTCGAFFTLWAMPLMMLIAGTTIWYNLRKRTVGEFVWERVKRLFVPFCTGLVLAIPPTVYFKAKQASGYAGSFIDFYPRFWQVKFSLSAWPLFIESGTSDWAFFISHLWFVLYLFVFTLLLLPLLLTLRRTAGHGVVERLAKILSRPWAIFALAFPIALIEALLTTERPGGWNRLVWPFFILYGFVFAAEPRFGQALVQNRRRALILGIVGHLLYFVGTGFISALDGDPFGDLSVVSIVVRFVKGTACWFWLVAIMGTVTHRSQRKANPEPGEVHSAQRQPAELPNANVQAPKSRLFNRAIAYVREGQVPLYVIHQTPIMAIAYYVVQWNVNALVKFVAIALPALLVTFLVYEIGIRRWRATRFLFGMKPRR